MFNEFFKRRHIRQVTASFTSNEQLATRVAHLLKKKRISARRRSLPGSH